MGYSQWKNKEDYFEKNGFTAAGKTFVVVGRNTYAVKDQLKDAGCTYNPDLGWHSPDKVFNLPDHCQCVEVKFDDLYDWSDGYKDVVKKTSVKSYIRSLYVEPDAKSQHLGQVGERLRDMEAVIEEIKPVPKWGAQIYVFRVGDNILTWFTTCVKQVGVGDQVYLNGTVKAHDSWSGNPSTALSRCVIKSR